MAGIRVAYIQIIITPLQRPSAITGCKIVLASISFLPNKLAIQQLAVISWF
jgi:hypothetical protein